MGIFWLFGEDSQPARLKSLRERWEKIKDSMVNVRRAFVLVWGAHPLSAMAMAVCSLIGAALPPAQAWVGKLIVDTVVGAINGGLGAQAGLTAALPWLLAELGMFVLLAANGQVRRFAEHVLHARINLGINSQIIRKALDLDLSHFENAEYYDKLQNARREADWRSLQIVD